MDANSIMKLLIVNKISIFFLNISIFLKKKQLQQKQKSNKNITYSRKKKISIQIFSYAARFYFQSFIQ